MELKIEQDIKDEIKKGTKIDEKDILAKMFDCAEPVVRKWICMMTKKTREEIFDDSVVGEPQCMYINHGSDRYELKLAIVPYEYDTNVLPEAAMNDVYNKFILQFMYDAVKTVYMSTVRTHMPDDKSMTDIDFIVEHFTYRPIIVPEKYRIVKMMTKKLEKLNEFKEMLIKNGEKELAEEADKDIAATGKFVQESINELDTMGADSIIEERGALIAKVDRIGLLVRKM